MFTTATPKVIDEKSVELYKEGKQFRMIMESLSEASFKILDNTPEHNNDASTPNFYIVVATTNVKVNYNVKIKLIPVNN